MVRVPGRLFACLWAPTCGVVKSTFRTDAFGARNPSSASGPASTSARKIGVIHVRTLIARSACSSASLRRHAPASKP